MRVVIDCNVLISAGISSGNCRKVLDMVMRYHVWCFSQQTLTEFVEVKNYSHLEKYRKKLDSIAATMVRVGKKVDLHPDTVDLPDPDDGVYVQTARGADAAVIVTGNKRDFPPESCAGIRIFSPREFLEIC